MEIVYFLLIGLCAGWLASLISKRGKFTLLGYLVIGVAGALVGGFVFGLLGLGAHTLLGRLIVATVGALLLLALLNYLQAGKRRRR